MSYIEEEQVKITFGRVPRVFDIDEVWVAEHESVVVVFDVQRQVGFPLEVLRLASRGHVPSDVTHVGRPLEVALWSRMVCNALAHAPVIKAVVMY